MEKWSDFFSLEIDDSFNPGTYVIKISTGENSIILPFWIHAGGDILAVVPSISNRIQSFSTDSKERRAIYTHGNGTGGRIFYHWQCQFSISEWKGGKIPKWVFPFVDGQKDTVLKFLG